MPLVAAPPAIGTRLTKLTLIVAAILLAAHLLDGPVRAEAVQCEGTMVNVSASTPDHHREVCTVVRRTCEFLGQLGLTITEPIEVRFAQKLSQSDPIRYFASYDKRRKVVEVLTLAAFDAMGPSIKIFRQQPSRQLLNSFVAHELVHAALSEAPIASTLPLVAHEYTAYVTQISLLDPKLRTAILDVFPLPAFAGLGEISLSYYLLAPEAFAVKSYRHFAAKPRGSEFLHNLVTGNIRMKARGSL